MTRLVFRLVPMLILALFASTVQANTSLLFSEYVEGSSYNKALEVFNGTDHDADLSQYSVAVYFNGAVDPGTTIALKGSLADKATFIL